MTIFCIVCKRIIEIVEKDGLFYCRNEVYASPCCSKVVMRLFYEWTYISHVPASVMVAMPAHC